MPENIPIPIDLDAITVDHELQSREATDSAAIEEYAESIGRGDQLPPVVVFFDGQTHWLADGFHRYPAHFEASKTSILAIVHQGTRDDARWYAAGANTSHGVRRTNADKRRQVEMALEMREESSDRTIAEHCGVSHTMVANIRKEVATVATPSPPVADGQVATVATPPPTEGGDLLSPPGDDEPTEDDVEETLREEVEGYAEPYRRATNDLLRIKRDLQIRADDSIEGGYVRLSITRIATSIDELKATIRQLEPTEFCPDCRGEGCERCQQTGFLTRQVVESRKQ